MANNSLKGIKLLIEQLYVCVLFKCSFMLKLIVVSKLTHLITKNETWNVWLLKLSYIYQEALNLSRIFAINLSIRCYISDSILMQFLLISLLFFPESSCLVFDKLFSWEKKRKQKYLKTAISIQTPATRVFHIFGVSQKRKILQFGYRLW